MCGERLPFFCSISWTHVSVQFRVCYVKEILNVGVDQHSRRPLRLSVVHLQEHEEQIKRPKKSVHPTCGVRASSTRRYLLRKTDFPAAQQQHAAFQLNVLLLQNVQIVLATVVSVHQLSLKTQVGLNSERRGLRDERDAGTRPTSTCPAGL